MGSRDDTERRIANISAKLDSGVDLDVGDVTFLLAYVPCHTDYRDLEVYRDEIEEAITGELGHAVYSSIVHEFESAGAIEEIRHDLIDPSLDPDGFERVEWNDRVRYPPINVGEKATFGVGLVCAPNKQPTSLWLIRHSIRDYLFCTGMGFHFDAEMIYEYEADYSAFLRAVIDCTDGLNEYELNVEYNEGEDNISKIIHVSLDSNGQSYHQEFEQVSDWLRFDALNPIQAALDDESSETIHYAGGNDGWILVLENKHSKLVGKYLYL